MSHSLLNDEQRMRLLDVLSKIFDDAARTCDHSQQAALQIEQALRKAGFAIVPGRAAR